MTKFLRITVEKALSHNKEDLIYIIAQLNKSSELIAKVDDQWRQIHLLKCQETKNILV